MPRTFAEKRIRHKRTRGGVLVPLLEDLFLRPVEFETDEDIDWLADVLRSMKARSENRINKPVYSPSQLSECLRYVYLLKHHKELGIKRKRILRPEANYYFFTGNFIHLKWQFALYKLSLEIADPAVFILHGVEVPIIGKRKDHGGTADAICSIYKEPYVIDFKGLNVRTFGEITRGEIPPQYAMQLGDYGMLWNSPKGVTTKIKKGLLVTENKGGPDNRHPLALHESEVKISLQLPEIRERLEVLREHEANKEIPAPECTSTKTLQYLGCPFAPYCKEEVKEREAKRRRSESKNTEGYRVAIPKEMGVIAPAEVPSDTPDQVPLDFTTLDGRSIGAIHSRYAVRHSHVLFHIAIRAASLSTLRRNARVSEAKFRVLHRGEKKTDVDAMMEDDRHISKTRNKISALESEMTILQAVAEGYEDLRNAASREMTRRIGERAQLD